MSILQIISESTNWSAVALAVTICLVIYVYLHEMPPGPIGLPYLGYYPFLSDDCYLELPAMIKKYGKVFCFTSTGQLYVHLPDLKTIREVTVTKADCFEKRPQNFILIRDLFEGGTFMTDGEKWKTLRKFFIMNFKEFGMGSDANIIQETLPKIITALNQDNGSPFDAINIFSGISSEVFLRLIFGTSKLNENDIQQFNEAFSAVIELTTGKNVLLAGPILKYILIPLVSKYRHYRKNKEQVDSIMTKIVQQHEEEFDRNNTRNVVDAYINERIFLEEKNDPRAKFFTEHSLVASLIEYYGDGYLGVGWITAAVLSVLSSYPEVQMTIQSEIDEVVGRNRLPSVDDKSRLPYTTAAIYEGLRKNTFLPLEPTLECTKETTIGGCRIPIGTIAVWNLWAAFNDPELYDEPDRFDPTRFLSKDGNKPRCEIPFLFGVGKRSCICERQAMMQILLYVSTVFQHFNLHPVDENKSKAERLSVFIKATPRAP